MPEIKPKKILLILLMIFLTAFAVFYLWKYFIFLPDDFSISRKEALMQGEKNYPEVIDYSMIENIDKALLTGDFGRSRIDSITGDLKKNDYLIKNDSFISANKSYLTFRFGTGASGIWVDERSSIMLPSVCSLSCSLDIKQNSKLEFAVISPHSQSKLTVEIVDGTNVILKKEIDLPAYKHPYTSKDIGVRSSNIGYPKAVADLGWKDVSIDLVKYAGRRTIRFSNADKTGCAFIANPRVFRRSEKKRYNIIYVLMDGISNPYYSFYNKNSNLTPVMKQIAEKDFIIFDNLFTLGDKTRISVAGLFTSEIPLKTRHGINRNYIPEEERELFYKYARSGKLASLPDVFRKAGYISTQLGNSGFTVDLIGTGVDYGFDRSYEFSVNPYNSYGISHRLFDFLRKNNEREFFLYLHYNTPHKPFYAPINYYIKGFFDSPIEAWWRPDFNACIRYSDDVFSHIYEALKKNNLLDNTIIIVASDHGAGYDVGKFDSGTQYVEYLRIPFIIHIPDNLKSKYGITTKRVDNFVSAINTAPTLTELTGLKKPQAFAGTSYIGLMNADCTRQFFDNEIWAFGRKQVSLITPDMFHYILTFPDTTRFVKRKYIIFGEEKEIPFELLYDLKNDPSEKNNLTHKNADILKKMRKIYLDNDFHHPERTVLSFMPSSLIKNDITVDVLCNSTFIGFGLFNKDIKMIQNNLKRVKISGGMSFSFSLTASPVYFIFENENDRAPVKISIKENRRLLNRENIFTNLNVNVPGNPLYLRDKNDFIFLNDTRLPVKEDFYDKYDGLRVKIVRIDLHRWIDIGQLELKSIGAGMKETLKSWGYIQ